MTRATHFSRTWISWSRTPEVLDHALVRSRLQATRTRASRGIPRSRVSGVSRCRRPRGRRRGRPLAQWAARETGPGGQGHLGDDLELQEPRRSRDVGMDRNRRRTRDSLAAGRRPLRLRRGLSPCGGRRNRLPAVRRERPKCVVLATHFGRSRRGDAVTRRVVRQLHVPGGNGLSPSAHLPGFRRPWGSVRLASALTCSTSRSTNHWWGLWVPTPSWSRAAMPS